MALPRRSAGRAPFASLGDEAAQQRDGAAGTRSCLVHTDVGRLTRLTTVLRRSQSEQSPPDGIASLSPARTGLDQGVTGERPTWLRTLRSSDLLRPVVAVNRLKLCLSVVASGLGLLVLAAFVVLTNKVALVITLAILGTIVFLLRRWSLAEARRTSVGR